MQNSINSVSQLGDIIRKRRKSLNLTQQELAGLCNVSAYFISYLENGKETAEIGKSLAVIKAVGLTIELGEYSWKASVKALDD